MNNNQGWQCPLCNTVYSPLVEKCNCANSTKDNTNTKDNNTNTKEASWVLWAGWVGNHDKRIEDAKCSNCGHKHHTVYGSLNELNKYCPNCNSKMSIIEK